MDIKSLILGIAMSLGIFAVKTGIGQYYCLAQIANKWKAIGLLLLLNFAYFAIFILSFILIININFLEYFNEIQFFFKSGMTIHIIMAFFMFYFGWKMIKSEKTEIQLGKSKYSILLLILPCPICSSAIFLTTAFTLNLLPNKVIYSFFISWGVFFTITMITLLILKLHKSQKNINSFIGELMLLISLYFFFNIAVAPNFKDMERIYRIAKYEGDKVISTNTNYLWAYALIAFSLFAGFIYKLIRNKLTTKSTKKEKNKLITN